MNKEQIDYIVLKTTEAFDLAAKKQGTKAKNSHVDDVFGARIKTSGKEAAINIIFSKDSAFIHLSSGQFSSKEDYLADCRTQIEFDKEIIEIEKFIKDCFSLKLIKIF